jgi:hypothetical protein
VLAIGHKRSTAEAVASTKSYLRSDFVSDEPDHASQGKKPEMRQRTWVEQPLNRLTKRDKGADEDREHHSQTSPTFPSRTSQIEGDSKRHRGKGISKVVDEIRKQRNAQRAVVDECLRERGDAEDRETDGHGPNPGSGSQDRAIYESVRVAVAIVRRAIRVPVLPVSMVMDLVRPKVIVGMAMVDGVRLSLVQHEQQVSQTARR